MAQKTEGLPKLIIIGDVITDIIVHLHEPIKFASDTSTSNQVQAGGSGANTAVWLARTGILQENLHFVGRVGKDFYGSFHKHELEQAGVTQHLAFDEQLSTGMIVVLVEPNSGERSFLTDRGANLGLKTEDLPLDLFQPGNYLHVSGYTLFDPSTRPVALSAIELAKSSSMFISVDPSSTSMLAKVGPDNFINWTKGTNLIFPNLDEGQILSGEILQNSILERLSNFYGSVVLKLGAEGAVWKAKEQLPVFQPADKNCTSPVLDTTGAGDAFCAGFLGEWIKSQNPFLALKAGSALASLAIGIVGARPDINHKNEKVT